MAYKKFKYLLLLRFFLLLVCVATVPAAYLSGDRYFLTGSVLVCLVVFIMLFRFVNIRFTEMDDFLESVKYRDFSRTFNEKSGRRDMRALHKSFNTVIKTIRAMNNEKQVQHIYLQRILEMVEMGIITYNTQTGQVLLVNNAFKEILDVPEFKNMSFLQKRRREFYEKVCMNDDLESTSMVIYAGKEKLNLLVSNSLFKIEEEVYKIIALQNIDETIDIAESEAWKKLLSVMTHEIMNSIAPISSLAETLQYQIRKSFENPQENELNYEDLEAGIESIRRRSDGLMQFAKTYRSLHKVTQLNLSMVTVEALFNNIRNLMLPSLAQKNILLRFELNDPTLRVNIDQYLIEQVLINLILNAIDAKEESDGIEICVSGFANLKEQVLIQVTDTGKGISDEILDKIFVPFFTTKKNGSGIGLSLSKQIMLLHKGKIKVESAIGKGTSVTLVFN